MQININKTFVYFSTSRILLSCPYTKQISLQCLNPPMQNLLIRIEFSVLCSAQYSQALRINKFRIKKYTTLHFGYIVNQTSCCFIYPLCFRAAEESCGEGSSGCGRRFCGRHKRTRLILVSMAITVSAQIRGTIGIESKHKFTSSYFKV